MGFSLNCLLLSFLYLLIVKNKEKQPGIGLYRAFSKCIAHDTAGPKVLESPSFKKRHYWANLAGKGRNGRAQKGGGRTGLHPGASMLHYRGGGCDRGCPEKEAGTKLRLG